MKEQSVKVIVRVRPLSERELAKNSQSIVEVDCKEGQITLFKPAEKDKEVKIFCFDGVFSQSETQADVYESTGKQLIEQVVEGYNGTIFAYGQTGSGKTYTMMGEVKSKNDFEGIIPRTFEQLVSTVESKGNKNYLIQCSYIEIYNEQIHDLLSSNVKNRLEIRQSPEKGVYVKDVKRATVKTIPQMLKYLGAGNNNRIVAQTLMNVESSRSHAIFTLYVESSEQIGQYDRFTASKFNLVDLAGSERQSKTGSYGDRLKQASKINLSLSALGNVISALVEGKDRHIPYRDSKLTRLLQDSLGGNTKTIMIANISPCSLSYEQTLSTLRYASRAKYIQNAPVINQDPKDTLLREYELEIRRLRQELEAIQTNAESEQPLTIEQNKSVVSNRTMAEKEELLERIRQLEGELIHPSVLKQQLIQQRNKREQQLSFIQKNYRNLEEEVQQMRTLLKELRRKYKVASKQIFQLEKQHEQERDRMADQYKVLMKQSIINKAVINTLFTEKQFNNLISLGQWESEEVFKLPPFYFKDKSTLAFPYEQAPANNHDEQVQEKKRESKENKRIVFNNSSKKK